MRATNNGEQVKTRREAEQSPAAGLGSDQKFDKPLNKAHGMNGSQGQGGGAGVTPGEEYHGSQSLTADQDSTRTRKVEGIELGHRDEQEDLDPEADEQEDLDPEAVGDDKVDRGPEDVGAQIHSTQIRRGDPGATRKTGTVVSTQGRMRRVCCPLTMREFSPEQ